MYRRGADYTFGSKTAHLADLYDKTPGPNAYLVKESAVKQRHPAISMAVVCGVMYEHIF